MANHELMNLLASELRKTGNPDDAKRAGVIEEMRTSRGEDIVIPLDVEAHVERILPEDPIERLLVRKERKTKGEIFTPDFAKEVNTVVSGFADDLPLGSLLNWNTKVEVSPNDWRRNFEPSPEEWFDYVGQLSSVTRGQLIAGLWDLSNLCQTVKKKPPYVLSSERFSVTLGEARDLYEKISHNPDNNIGPRTAFMVLAFKKSEPLNKA